MKPTIPEVLPLAKAYVRKPWFGVGGNLHIVLDDGNIENSNILFCQDLCRGDKDVDGERLCGLLLQMTKTQRRKIVRQCWRKEVDPCP